MKIIYLVIGTLYAFPDSVIIHLNFVLVTLNKFCYTNYILSNLRI